MAAPLPSIAVVAVHGVGNHVPGGSAHAVADLLLRLRDPDGASRFDAFQEQDLRIPTRPAIVHAKEETEPTERGSIYTEQSNVLRASIEHPQSDTLAIEHQFMREQLSEFQSTGEPYETVRLAGRRLARSSGRGGDAAAQVDIYEMHWADLSRLRSGMLAIFGELYQMLFHVAHLGRLAIDHATVEYNGIPGWRVHAIAHRWAVRLLTAFVPVFWLTMLVTVLGVVALQLPQSAKPVIVTVSGVVMAVALVWRLIYRFASRRGVAVWLAIPVAGIVVARLLWLYAQAEAAHALHLDRAVLFTWMLLGSFLSLAVCSRYERVRPGAFMTGVACVALAFGTTLGFAIPADSRAQMMSRTVNIFEVETVSTVGLWYALYACGILSAVGGWWARRHLRDGALARARRAAWTACATLSLSSSSVLVITFVMWAGIYMASRSLLPPVRGAFLFGFFGNGADTYDAFFGNVLRTTAGAGFPLLLIVMSVLAAAAVLAFLPAVLREVWPSRSGDAFDLRAAQASAANGSLDEAWARMQVDTVQSQRLGEWLTAGFRGLMFVVTLLFATTFIVQPLATVTHWIAGPRIAWLDTLQSQAQQIILVLGGWLAAAAVGLLALRDRLESLALGFRPMLDSALDVDNYLRQHPRSKTPRAKIAERYASLLRYLARWRDPAGAPYSAIVIVAHSQGTVITADMLGFLQRERDPEIDPILTGARDGAPAASPTRLFLFTMGSPLRQLYASSFPHLFGWVNEEPRGWGGPSVTAQAGQDASCLLDRRQDESHVVVPPEIPPHASPDPLDLGLTRWVNAYRSGDYVGRALWRTATPEFTALYAYAASDARTAFPDARPPLTYVSEDGARSRRELCIGRGAHTHYWDDTAKAVAIELDALVRDAAMTAAPRVLELDVRQDEFLPSSGARADGPGAGRGWVNDRPAPASGTITLDPSIRSMTTSDLDRPTSPGSQPQAP